MQELLRDPVIQMTRLLPDVEEDTEQPLEKLTVSTATKNKPLQVHTDRQTD